MRYKQLVAQIRNLCWDVSTTNDLQCLMVLSAFAAEEFSESLRIALEHNPENASLQKMAEGELKANNLQFDDYTKRGDHYAFLLHFITKHKVLSELNPRRAAAIGAVYMEQVRRLDRHVRIMSVVSREQELPGVFTSMLEAKGWDELSELRAFKYYLERHIALDSGEGGHADLLSGFEVDDSVTPFYETRLNMYRFLPVLFT